MHIHTYMSSCTYKYIPSCDIHQLVSNQTDGTARWRYGKCNVSHIYNSLTQPLIYAPLAYHILHDSPSCTDIQVPGNDMYYVCVLFLGMCQGVLPMFKMINSQCIMVCVMFIPFWLTRIHDPGNSKISIPMSIYTFDALSFSIRFGVPESLLFGNPKTKFYLSLSNIHFSITMSIYTFDALSFSIRLGVPESLLFGNPQKKFYLSLYNINFSIYLTDINCSKLSK
jgi:hypothetical protein